MADDDDDKSAAKSLSQEERDEIMKEARERFERCQRWETQARVNALFDARFEAGDAVNQWQWDQATRDARAGRPCLTDNKTRQNNLLIVNDARQNKAQIKISPTGGNATYEAAQIYSGIIRRIEYQSKAVDAYSTGIFHQVSTGIGYCLVETDYADDKSFDQDIFIRRVPDPNTIYLDPDAREYDKADMCYAFVFEDVPRDEYEAEHGEGDMPPATTTLDNSAGWNDQDHVRIAEYWRRNERTDTLHRLVDGTVFRQSEVEPEYFARVKQLKLIVVSRDIGVPEIEWFKLCGDRIDEHKTWPGRYIPIVPFIGEETVIEGIMDRKGHTRSQIDAQRMLNYWSSAAVEHVALQTKVPWITDKRAIEGHENYWDYANVQNFAYLPINGIDDTGQPIEKPVRPPAPEMPQAYIAGLSMAKDALMFTTGQYQANLGAPSNETSGIAIQRRQRQGDTATYHYIDNQAKAIRQIGRICLDLIPHVYDVARVIKIMAEDGSLSDVHVDPDSPVAHQHVMDTPQGPQPIMPGQAQQATEDDNTPDPRVIFNPNIGEYAVEADVGPSYATQRQEAFNAFGQIISQNKELAPALMDFWAQNADFPGADKLAERMKRGLPPQYRAGPDPETVKVQQQAHQLLGQADQHVNALTAQIAALQAQLADKGTENAIKDYDAETKRLATVGDIDPNALKLLVREMVSQMIGMPAVPVMAAHAQAEQAMLPPEPAPTNGAS
jgi:hypothetical protein